MARSIEEIRAIIKAKARTFTSLDDLLFADDLGAISGSNFIDATESVVEGIQAFELVADAIKTELNNLAAAAPSGNQAWIQAQILKFQFGDKVQIDPETFVVSYPVLDVSKQIITRCSVTVDPGTSVVQIKVAKSEPPEPLTTTELDALEDYYFGDPLGEDEGVGFAGVQTQFVNLQPDRLFVEGVVRYDGEFDPIVIKANVITAIENFIASFTNTNFNGTVKMQELTAAILAVAGVSRFEYAVDGIKARPQSVVFAAATVINQNGFYDTDSGYLISEDEPGETLVDKISTQLES